MIYIQKQSFLLPSKLFSALEPLPITTLLTVNPFYFTYTINRESLRLSTLYERLMASFLALPFLLAVTAPCMGQSRGEKIVYGTGDCLEPDRIASAWLIKRFVSPEANFKFFSEGRLINEGIAFDTPDAKFQRAHNQSTFEVIKSHYNIDDPQLADLTAIIHNNEIDFWAGNNHNRSSNLIIEINRIIKASTDNHRCLQECFSLLDKFIERN